MLLFSLLIFTLIWIVVAKYAFSRQISISECFVQFGATTVIVGLVVLIGDYQSSTDNELYHGQVTAKERTQNYFQTSYDCYCICVSRNKDGRCTNEICQTCYTDHYTVNWALNTTLGDHHVDYIDQESKTAWNTPDPEQYRTAYVGQPFSKAHMYTNYFLLYKESLFNHNASLAKYQKQLEFSKYPDVVGYFVNLVYASGVKGIDTTRYNDLIRTYLNTAGVAKQVNIILYFTAIQDPNFRYALEAKWTGGKKNDVIVIIGVDPVDAKKATWVDTITLGKNIGNEMLGVSIREDIIKSDLSDPKATTDKLFTNVGKYFHRKPMSNFKYMEAARQTPIMLVMSAFILTIFLNVLFTYINVKHDHFSFE